MSDKKAYDKVTIREGKALNRDLGKDGTSNPAIMKKLGNRAFDARAKGAADYAAAQAPPKPKPKPKPKVKK